jgi:Ni/Co efflux regulator RcnB
MKSILLSGTAAVLLLAASTAFAAQPDDQHHPDAGAANTHATGDTHMSGPADQHGTMSGNTMSAHPGVTTHTTRHTRTRTRTRTTHTTTTAAPGNTHAGDNNHMGDHTPGNDNTMHASNGGHHAQIDVKFRIAATATHHFHAGAYRAPSGYAYRRHNIGDRLDAAFYARDYWLTDYATYDLMAPPDGYVWVRFGPDALLIDEDTGEVVRIQYGLFD